MREKYITVNRDLIRLKIRGLLKKEIVDSNPLIVEFILNKVMGYNVVDEFLKASVNLLEEEYIEKGTRVEISLQKLKNWSNDKIIEEMKKDPDKYGIDVENNTITGIISEVYYYGPYDDYCVEHPFLSSEGRFITMFTCVNKRDIII
jgi:hypothetical protein